MTLAAHLPEYLAAIDRRAAEDPDGDYDPIQPEYFERAKAFLTNLAEHAPDLPKLTAIYPSADGCILITWEGPTKSIDIEVENTFEMFLFDGGRITHRQQINPDCPICREQVVAAVEGSL